MFVSQRLNQPVQQPVQCQRNEPRALMPVVEKEMMSLGEARTADSAKGTKEWKTLQKKQSMNVKWCPINAN